jgi:hypothetical protein
MLNKEEKSKEEVTRRSNFPITIVSVEEVTEELINSMINN